MKGARTREADLVAVGSSSQGRNGLKLHDLPKMSASQGEGGVWFNRLGDAGCRRKAAFRVVGRPGFEPGTNCLKEAFVSLQMNDLRGPVAVR